MYKYLNRPALIQFHSECNSGNRIAMEMEFCQKWSRVAFCQKIDPVSIPRASEHHRNQCTVFSDIWDIHNGIIGLIGNGLTEYSFENRAKGRLVRVGPRPAQAGPDEK